MNDTTQGSKKGRKGRPGSVPERKPPTSRLWNLINRNHTHIQKAGIYLARGMLNPRQRTEVWGLFKMCASLWLVS